jgi:hypothetical protein
MIVNLRVVDGSKQYIAEIRGTDPLIDLVGKALAEVQSQIDAEPKRTIPVWQDYDVITVLLGKDHRPYTYMRRDGYWPGERSWTEMDDDKVDDMWERCRVALIVRDGHALETPLTKDATVWAGR